MQGRMDLDLSPAGREQVAALLPLVRSLRPEVFYTSPVVRTRATATLLAKPGGQRVIIEPDFTELNVGEWLGKTRRELLELESWRVYQERPSQAFPYGGESLLALQERVVRGIKGILAREPRCVAIVTHSDVIRVALCHQLGLPLDYLHVWKIGLASLSVLEWEGTVVSVSAVNCAQPALRDLDDR